MRRSEAWLLIASLLVALGLYLQVQPGDKIEREREFSVPLQVVGLEPKFAAREVPSSVLLLATGTEEELRVFDTRQVEASVSMTRAVPGEGEYAVRLNVPTRANVRVTARDPVIRITVEERTVKRIDVESANEMYDATMSHWPAANIGIFSAAVADYKPQQIADQKIKKTSAELQIKLSPTPDILAAAGASKKTGQFLVGFALETENEIANAKSKLQRKNADLIVLNSLKDAGAGFGHDTNVVQLISTEQEVALPLASKDQIARNIVSYLCKQI